MGKRQLPQDFLAAINDDTTSVVTDFSADSDVMLIAFASAVVGDDVPPYEFHSLVSDISCKKVFVRDLNRLWYHGGLPGFSDDVDQTLEGFRRLMEQQGVKKLITVGVSMGGYAAILYGTLLGAEQIYTFSPNTRIYSNLVLRLWGWKTGTTEHVKHIIKIKEEVKEEYKETLNLRHWLNKRQEYPEISVYYPSKNRTDSLHAINLRKMPNITLHPLDTKSHSIILPMYKSGKLKKMFIEALAEPDL